MSLISTFALGVVICSIGACVSVVIGEIVVVVVIVVVSGIGVIGMGVGGVGVSGMGVMGVIGIVRDMFVGDGSNAVVVIVTICADICVGI